MNPNKRIILIGTKGISFYTFRSNLIKILIGKGFQVYAFISEHSIGDIKKIEALGVIPIVYNLNSGSLNPFADILSVWQMKNKIKEIQPDLVFSFFVKPVIYGTLSAKWANVPKVIGMLEGLGYFFTEQPDGLSRKTKLIKWIQIILYKLSLPMLDKIIFLNHDDVKDLLDKYHIKVKCVEVLGGIGVDLEDYPYCPIIQIVEPISFIFIARLLKEKGIREFIKAAEIVKMSYPNTVFTVLGGVDKSNPGGLSENELNHYVQSGLIKYERHVSDVNIWLARSHIFVLPSYYREGVPRSTQEAMAVGRAVITTDVPGCRDTVIDGKNGFLIPRWNANILAEKMIFFIEHPDAIREMGDASYQMALEYFDAEKVNRKLLGYLGF